MAYLGHLLMENRNGLIVDAMVTAATGMAERDAALTMLGELPTGGRMAVGGDANDVTQFPETPHRGSAIDGRTTRHPDYDISQRKRKLVEQAFGWMKTVGLLRHTPPSRFGPLVDWLFMFHAAAYNLVRRQRTARRAGLNMATVERMHLVT